MILQKIAESIFKELGVKYGYSYKAKEKPLYYLCDYNCNFSTVGMNISLMNTNADKLLKKFEYSSTWNNFMAVFRTSISGRTM